MLLEGRGGRRGRLTRGRYLAGVAVAGCVCVLVLLVGLGAARSNEARGIGLGTVSRPVSVGGVASGDRASLARVRHSVVARAERRRRWLESSAAREQRAASRMAFHGLRAGSARSLLVRDYGSVVAGVSANPAASVGRGGTVVRYEGDYRAVVRTARGLEVEDSSVPLRVGGDGVDGGHPVDLTLGAGEDGFAPANPLVGLSIARDSGGGVGVGSDGLRITMEGSSVPGSSVGGQSVFFGGVGADMDAVVAPSLRGAELFAVLRSRLSPEQLRYRVTLPAGATLQALAGWCGSVAWWGDSGACSCSERARCSGYCCAGPDAGCWGRDAVER